MVGPTDDAWTRYLDLVLSKISQNETKPSGYPRLRIRGSLG